MKPPEEVIQGGGHAVLEATAETVVGEEATDELRSSDLEETSGGASGDKNSKDLVGLQSALSTMEGNIDQHARKVDLREDSAQYEWDSLLQSGVNTADKGAGTEQGLAAFQKKLVRTALEAMECGDLPDYGELWDRESAGKTNYSSQGDGITFPLSMSFSGDQDVRKRYDPGKPTSSDMVMESFRRDGMDGVHPFVPKNNPPTDVPRES